MALFGCYDKDRSGRIDYRQWIGQLSAGKQISAKAWDNCLEWAEREAKWAALEQKWQQNVPTEPDQSAG